MSSEALRRLTALGSPTDAAMTAAAMKNIGEMGRPSFRAAYEEDQRAAIGPQRDPAHIPPQRPAPRRTVAEAAPQPRGPVTGDLLFAEIAALKGELAEVRETLATVLEENRAFVAALTPVLESLANGTSLTERVAHSDGNFNDLDDILKQPVLGPVVPKEIIEESVGGVG